MGCYTVPLLAAGMHYVMRRKRGWHDTDHKVLTALLSGAALFGVIDHAWNAELLTFTLPDVLLGVAITTGVVVAAGIYAYARRATALIMARDSRRA